jgi:CubicO group peptidase (beta-lactamase class C family)
MMPAIKSFFFGKRTFTGTALLSGLFFFSIIILSACQSTTQPAAARILLPGKKIELPKPIPLSTAESMHLQRACQLWFDTVLKPSAFNGGMLVAKGGNIVFEQYRGTNPLGSADSVNAETVFHIASVSKTITAMAILKMTEQGKLHLDDELNHFFPDFNYPGVTIRSLLNHRSGLPNYLYFVEDLKWNETIALKNQDVFNYLVNRKAEIKNIAPPNTHFSYCNTNYALLALLIEKISGLSYPQYLQQNFFEPLQMKQSFVYTPQDSSRASANYDWRGKVIANNYLDYVYGDKNIYTTPRDLFMLERALSSNLLLKKETMEEAYQPYSNEKPGIKNYGLGWRMNIYPNGKKVIFHNGWWHGNNASFIRLRDQDATIIVLSNRFNRATYKAYHLINFFENYFEVLEEVE